MFDALSPQRRRLVLTLSAAATALAVGVVAVVVVRSVTGAGSTVAQDRPGPVLVLPGYGGDTTSLQPLADTLRTAGRTVRVVESIDGGTGDLRLQAERLDEIAEELLLETDAPSVDVVGYSAGGVVARLWVRDHGGAQLARRVLTLGSPQHGTAQAELGGQLAGGCPEACVQLAPDSDLLRRLNAGDETPDGPIWVTIRTTADEVVTPVDSAALEGALNILVQDLCPAATTSHGELPRDPVVLAALTSTLGPRTPRTPDHVDC